MDGLLHPFVGYVPESGYAHRIVGPPSASLSDEDRNIARNDPLSFRHVAGRKASRPFDEAAEWLRDSKDKGLLRQVGPCVVIYRQKNDDFTATGIIADLSIEAYVGGRVKRHERTIAKTQAKMADYMRTTRMYGNPAVTAFRPNTGLDAAIATHTEHEAESAFTTVDGVSHELWVVDGDSAAELCRIVDSEVYITDGHHRLAAAALVATEEGREKARIPAGVFSASQFRLRSFARSISDPEMDEAATIARLQTVLETEEVTQGETTPRTQHEYGARIGGRYFLFRLPSDRIPHDQYGALNTNLLTDIVLRPVFGIEDPRLDSRLQFVADLGDIDQSCLDADAWFLPHPLEVGDVMAVADSGRTMPAKSTWFAPKLPSGLVIRPIDTDGDLL